MALRYIHIAPDTAAPVLPFSAPYRAIICADVITTFSWQAAVSKWLIDSGCVYAIAWGNMCKSWHDNIDDASLIKFDWGDIPDDQHVMTTWHDDEPLDEVMWFAFHAAKHPEIELQETVFLHISLAADEERILSLWDKSISA